MAFFLAPIQSGHHQQHQQQQQQQQQQHPQPAVFQFIPMQNPAHPQHAALQAAHPFPGHVIENHNPAPVPPAAPAIAPAPAPTPVNNAPNQAVMVAVHGRIGAQPIAVAQPQVPNWFGWAAPADPAAPAAPPAPVAVQQPQLQQLFAPNPQQLHAQNVAAAQVNGANAPRQLVPCNPPPGQVLWVHNLDGSWTLRTVTDIQNKLHGQWHRSKSGYPYFRVHAKIRA
ncbi:predicted protein [Histoplasma capsulatum var. duboisii H88]|uniref:Predicted protein n=1 Tax=Ajellomyces capsulatus (strain H88) TaxID=544711 RepID=F0UPN5_AJEC8|nr:predicted protein [Histoplasma capsulatum var. duboisii H88]